MSAESLASVALRTGPPLQAGAEPSVMASFDRLARLASELLDVPCATVFLVDGDEVRPANPGAAGYPPILAVVARTVLNQAIASGDASGVVTCPDTRAPTLHGVPAEAPETGVGSFAAAILRDPRGLPAGAFLLCTPAAREWSDRDVRLLERLAEFAVTCIELMREAVGRSEAEAAFAAQQTYFAELFESAPEGILLIDEHDRVVHLNTEFRRMFGYTVEEAVGKQVNDLIVPDERSAEGLDLTVRVARGERIECETVRRRKDGSLLDVSILGRPFLLGDGRSAAYGIYRDISARKRTERNLRFLAEASAALVDSLDYETTLARITRLAVPVLADHCVLDLVGEDGVPRRIETVHVDPAKEAVAREIGGRYPLENASKSAVAEAFRTGRSILMPTVSPEHFRAIATDAEHLRLLEILGIRSAMIVPLTARGRTMGVLTFSITESDRRYDEEDLAVAEELARIAALAVDNARLYDEALVANRAKSSFLAVMGHELRTPLTTIIGYAELLLHGVPGPLPEAAIRYAERIRAGAWHLTDLIEQILTFSRMEAGRDEVRLESTELVSLVRSAVALIAPIAEDKGLAFHTELPEEPVHVATDPSRMRQILLNLLSNAVKFTERGEVRLVVTLEEEHVVYQVSDTGIGIAAEHLERIFSPFWQVEDPATRRAGGTGLGLSVTQRLVQMLGGRIGVRSRPGEGSTFTVRLPRDVPLRAASQQAADVGGHGSPSEEESP